MPDWRAFIVEVMQAFASAKPGRTAIGLRPSSDVSDKRRGSRQNNSDLGELAGRRIDLDSPGMLLHDDVVSDGQAKAGTLSGGLVVKKGLNIFSLTSGEMPVPLSRIVISTRSPRFFVEAARVGSKPSLVSCSLRLLAA